MAKRKKDQYSNRFNEDYTFYSLNRKKATFCGQNTPKFEYCEDGETAKEAFFQLDTYGKAPKCKEPELLWEIVRTKKSINWQIKMWVDGFYDMCEPFKNYMKCYIDPPSWVLTSFKNAVFKKYKFGMSKGDIEFWRREYSNRR